MNGLVELTRVGFECKGRFNRAGVREYSRKYQNPVTTPYVDGLVSKIIEDQGFETKHLIDPANLYDPDQLVEGLARYRREKKFEPNEDVLQKAFSFAFNIFAKPKDVEYLQVLNDVEALAALKPNTSAGVGLVGKKGKNLPIGLRREGMVRRGEKAPNPCLAFARTQRGNKTRLVWGYPLEMTIMEARFAKPLIDHFLEADTPMAIGRMKFVVGAKICCTIAADPYVYSLDYSKYDSSIHERLIRMAFSILETWFPVSQRKEYGWGKIVNYFVRTPIVMPDGKLYVGKTRGVPSGSFFTQVIDSIVNVLALRYVTLLQGVDLASSKMLVLGDDSIFGTKRPLDLQRLKADLETIGITLNLEKSEVNTNHFLGAYWRACLPHLSLNEVVKRAICPEKPRYIGLKTEEQRIRMAVEVLMNLGCSWVEATKLAPILNHASTYCLKKPKKVDVDTLFALERSRFVEGLSIGIKRSPWLRVLT